MEQEFKITQATHRGKNAAGKRIYALKFQDQTKTCYEIEASELAMFECGYACFLLEEPIHDHLVVLIGVDGYVSFPTSNGFAVQRPPK